MWNIESIEDLDAHRYTGELEADEPKPFVSLSKEQFLRIRDAVIEHRGSLVIVNEGSGYRRVLLFDDERELVGQQLIPAN